ncbi:hypothetical protein ACHWQZ_G011517 [Mnemiopsis leidyi]
MLIYFALLSQITLLYGAPGCIDLKREFNDLSIARKPIRTSDGTCPLSKTCCTLEVENAVKNDTVGGLRGVVSKEIKQVKDTLETVKTMTAGEMVQMMDELVPADIKESLDLQRIGDAIWQYTIGDITAYNLTIEVAVIGSGLIFTDKAAQNLIDMTECIIRQLGQHATDAFVKIAAIVEEQLEAPKTFGDGFAVAEVLLNSIENFELPEDCAYGEILGCKRCGIKIPSVCRSTCTNTAHYCLGNVYSQSALWIQWVESLTSLVDAMVLMKDIEIDPKDIVTPDLIEEITQDIMSAMANVNFKQCRGIGKRSVPSYNPEGFRNKRQMSQGQLLGSLLEGFFSSFTLDRNSCRDSSSDTECWLGREIGNYVSSEENSPSRFTKSFSPNSETKAAMEVSNYAQRVDAVISKIHSKVREQRSRIPDGYQMYSSCLKIQESTLVTFLTLTFLLFCSGYGAQL